MQKCLTKHRMGSIIYYDYDTVFCVSNGKRTVFLCKHEQKRVTVSKFIVMYILRYAFAGESIKWASMPSAYQVWEEKI